VKSQARQKAARKTPQPTKETFVLLQFLFTFKYFLAAVATTATTTSTLRRNVH